MVLKRVGQIIWKKSRGISLTEKHKRYLQQTFEQRLLPPCRTSQTSWVNLHSGWGSLFQRKEQLLPRLSGILGQSVWKRDKCEQMDLLALTYIHEQNVPAITASMDVHRRQNKMLSFFFFKFFFDFVNVNIIPFINVNIIPFITHVPWFW